MQCFALALISFLLVYTVVPYPLLAHPSLESTSPRISCTFVHARRHCARFQLPIPRRMPPLSPLLKQLPNAIIGSGPLTSEEDHQIQRIMDVKEPISEGSEGTWLIPDVQVVLWFVVLCCFMEGIVSGFSWWRRPRSLAAEQRRMGEKTGSWPEMIEEGDEDDEANIPVL